VADITANLQNILIAAGAIIISMQLLLTIYMAVSLRIAAKERALLNKEMFGLLKKLEGLTASRREQMIRHYDRILESLSSRLPPTIASHTSQMIYETESKILKRLAELEPNLKEDDLSRRKMDDLVKTMENLEQTIVFATAETVRKVMLESRHNLMEDESPCDISLAA